MIRLNPACASPSTRAVPSQSLIVGNMLKEVLEDFGFRIFEQRHRSEVLSLAARQTLQVFNHLLHGLVSFRR